MFECDCGHEWLGDEILEECDRCGQICYSIVLEEV